MPREGARDIASSVAAITVAAERVSDEVAPVQFVQSIFVSSEESWFLLFESDSAAAVGTAASRAGLKFARISEARSDWATNQEVSNKEVSNKGEL